MLCLGGHLLGSGETMAILASRKACAFIHLSEMEGFVASHLARARQPLQQCQFHSLNTVSATGLRHSCTSTCGQKCHGPGAGWRVSKVLTLTPVFAERFEGLQCAREVAKNTTYF